MPRTNQQLARRQELRAAKEQGGKRVQGSGNYSGLPGDVNTDEFLVECKFTSKPYLRIQLSWLKKIEEEALAKGKVPLLRFGFREKDDVVEEWIAFPEWYSGKVLGVSIWDTTRLMGGESCVIKRGFLSMFLGIWFVFSQWSTDIRWAAVPASHFRQ